MKKILLLPILCFVFSCQEDEQTIQLETPVNPTPPVNPAPTVNAMYIFDNTNAISELKYHKGPDGKGFPTEAESFFKTQWTTFSDPAIKSVRLNKDSIFIEENQVTSKYKYQLDNKTIVTADDQKLALGKLENNQLTIYKNFVSYNVVDKTSGGLSYGKSVNIGLVTDKTIFPRIITSLTELKTTNEFVFYGNVGYQFSLKK